jgi:putative PEP-CTERM system TPR-repeat lipoprotein
MNSKKSFSRYHLPSLLMALMLVACGEKPDAMLISAKDYLARNDSKAAVIQIKNALQSNPDLPEARYLLGVALLDGGDPVGAETELRKALTLKVPQAQVAPYLAKAMLAQGQAKKVTDEFGQMALTQTPGMASLQTTLAESFAAQGLADQSQAALSAALKTDATYAPALLLQARQKAGQRDFDGALLLVDGLIAKSPKNYEALKLKGDLLLYAKNQPDDALTVYRQSVDARPDFMAAHSAATSILFQQGKLDEAEKQIAKMKAFAPNHPQTKYMEAQLAFQRKDFKLARGNLQQVLKVAPNNILAVQLAGAVELQLDSVLQAESYLIKALQLAPDLPLARRLLVTAYLRSGNTTKALATLAPGLNMESVDPGLLSLAGEVYLQAGDVKKAEDYFAKASKQDPQNARKRTALAVTQLMGGQVDSAFGELENIAASDKGTTADMALVSAHLRRQEFDKALKAIEALERKQPDKPVAAMLQGRTYLAKKDASLARKSFERALVIDPTYFPAVASLAAMDVEEKKPEDAKKRFESVLGKDPKNGQALLALAELSARSGVAKEEVARLIGNAVTANPTEATPRLLLIDFHLRNKDVKRALASAQDGIAAIPDNPELLDALGLAQQASGEFNQAITTFNKVAVLQPLSSQPYLRLAEAHLASNDKAAARQDLRKALELKPDLQQAQRGSIMLDVDGKRFPSALSTAQTMQKQSPNDPIGYVLEGDVYVAQKNWDSAIAAYRNGLKQAPSAELALKYHGVNVASGKNADAEKFASAWQKDHPKDVTFLLYLADAAMARKDYGQAERNYLAVLKLQDKNAVAYNNLAWVTARLNKDGAIAYAEKAIAIAPNQPAFMDTLAVLLSEKNEHAKAIELQKKAVALQPEMLLFKLNLAKIQIKAGDKTGAKSTLDELSKRGDKFDGQAEVTALLKTL